MNSPDTSRPRRPAQRLAEAAMAGCLGVMAAAVFLNVVLRYGFGSGIAASEELSRLLFVWMVFIGAAAAYPRGEHMAFTSLLLPLRRVGFLAVRSRPVDVVLMAGVGVTGLGALSACGGLQEGGGGGGNPFTGGFGGAEF